MKEAVIDSVFWIAIKRKKDKWHQRANNMIDIVIKLEQIFITEAVLTETVNFILRKENAKIAYEVANDLLTSDKIILLENNEISRLGTVKIMEEYTQLSFTDANIIWHMKNKKIKNLVSFDSGFDNIPNIIRNY